MTSLKLLRDEGTDRSLGTGRLNMNFLEWDFLDFMISMTVENFLSFTTEYVYSGNTTINIKAKLQFDNWLYLVLNSSILITIHSNFY